MGPNFENWDPHALACLKYPYDPGFRCTRYDRSSRNESGHVCRIPGESPAFSGRYTVDPYSISITGRAPIKLHEELRSGGGSEFATSRRFAQTVLVTKWNGLLLLVRSHSNTIDPDIERAVQHIQNWR